MPKPQLISSLPGVSYIWAGPPRALSTIGPDLFYDYFPERRITFYCLDECLESFKLRFQNTTVEVVSIENILASCKHRESHLLKRYFPSERVRPSQQLVQDVNSFVSELKKRSKEQNSRVDQVRELVTIKELMQYFLAMILFDEYIVDTNLVPMDRKKLEQTLPKLKHLTVPLITPGDMIDPWLRYSHKPDKTSLRCFTHYFNCAKKEFDRRETNQPIDSLALNNAFVEASSGYKSCRTMIAKKRFFGDTTTLLGMRKRYTNSHRQKSFIDPPHLAFLLVGECSFDEFNYTLKKIRESGELQFTYQYGERGSPKTLTLLHNAISKGKDKELECLIEIATSLHTEVSCNVSSKEMMCSPLRYAIITKQTRCAQLLIEEIIKREYDGTIQQFISSLAAQSDSIPAVLENTYPSIQELVPYLEINPRSPLVAIIDKGVEGTQLLQGEKEDDIHSRK